MPLSHGRPLALALALSMGACACAREAPPLSPAAPPVDTRIRVPRWIEPPPPPRTRFLYSFEDPEALQAFRAAEGLDRVLQGATTPFEHARALGGWARAQFPPTRPDPYPPLSAPIFLAEIRAGRTGGFCAQYAALVVQGLASVGIYARHATIRDHEVIEVFTAGAPAWAYYDPMHDVWAVDEKGQVLDGLSMHRRLLGEEPGEVRFQSGAEKTEEWYASYATQVRSFFAVWLKNNWASAPRNFEDIPRFLLFWCPDPAGCTLPEGSSSSRWRPDFDAVPLEPEAYRARAAAPPPVRKALRSD